MAPRLAFSIAGLLVLSGGQQVAMAQTAAFPVWLEGLRVEAIQSGISTATVNAALADVAPIARIIELERNQPEFKLEVWT